jgi:hypothetical protein
MKHALPIIVTICTAVGCGGLSSSNGGQADSAVAESGATDTKHCGAGSVDGSGGSSLVTLASGQGAVLFIALDATNVYWTERVHAPGPVSTFLGSVMKVPRGGGAAVTLATC